MAEDCTRNGGSQIQHGGIYICRVPRSDQNVHCCRRKARICWISESLKETSSSAACSSRRSIPDAENMTPIEGEESRPQNSTVSEGTAEDGIEINDTSTPASQRQIEPRVNFAC